MFLEIVKYFRNSLSDIEKLALHPTFLICENIVFFLEQGELCLIQVISGYGKPKMLKRAKIINHKCVSDTFCHQPE